MCFISICFLSLIPIHHWYLFSWHFNRMLHQLLHIDCLLSRLLEHGSHRFADPRLTQHWMNCLFSQVISFCYLTLMFIQISFFLRFFFYSLLLILIRTLLLCLFTFSLNRPLMCLPLLHHHLILILFIHSYFTSILASF